MGNLSAAPLYVLHVGHLLYARPHGRSGDPRSREGQKRRHQHRAKLSRHEMLGTGLGVLPSDLRLFTHTSRSVHPFQGNGARAVQGPAKVKTDKRQGGVGNGVCRHRKGCLMPWPGVYETRAPSVMTAGEWQSSRPPGSQPLGKASTPGKSKVLKSSRYVSENPSDCT